MTEVYTATILTGGLAGCLDKIDGAKLGDGDAASVYTDAGVYHYHLNASSGASENSPFRIVPDQNAGNKVWHLIGTTARIGALVNVNTTQSIPGGTWTALDFQVEQYDDATFWDVANPSRITIPIGITKAIFKTNTYWATSSAGDRRLRLYKNGVGEVPGGFFQVHQAVAEPGLNACTGALDVTATDYYEVEVYQSSGGSLNINSTANRTWFSIEAVAFA